ncbi:MAG: hypothetical protein F4234_10565 [Gammaproteobacteria bacterium]|nr:hypothetical protein [Gammaproteobacteria bacterium]
MKMLESVVTLEQANELPEVEITTPWSETYRAKPLPVIQVEVERIELNEDQKSCVQLLLLCGNDRAGSRQQDRRLQSLLLHGDSALALAREILLVLEKG